MLTCSDIVAKSSDYIDRELPLAQRVRVRMHLLMCRHCRRFVRHLARATAFLQRLPEPTLGAADTDAILQLVKNRP